MRLFKILELFIVQIILSGGILMTLERIVQCQLNVKSSALVPPYHRYLEAQGTKQTNNQTKMNMQNEIHKQQKQTVFLRNRHLCGLVDLWIICFNKWP